MARRLQPSLRFADGGSFVTRWAQNTGVRFQDGGVVPGTGRGDKIPAKYEPGEFVVSNDMIDDNPGLREQLSGLRAETLAARGKTVEEADAKALRYHGGLRGGAHGQETRNEELPAAHAGGRDFQRLDGASDNSLLGRGGGAQGARHAQVSLRANAGFSGSADPDFWRGNPNPLQGNQTLLDAARQRIDPVQSAAAQAANARAAVPEGPATRPTAPLPPDQAAAYDASPEGRATKAQVLKEGRGYFQGSPNTAPTGAAPAGAAPTPAGSKWFGSADDWKNLAKGPADSPHKTLRMTAPSAPTGLAKAGGAVQGLAGAYNAYEGLQEGDAWKAGVGAADAVAGAALLTPAAPIAGAYLGVRGAYDTAKAAGGAIYDNLTEKARDTIGGTLNQIGLNTGLWGEDDSAKLMADAQARLAKPADTPRTTTPSAAPDPRNPYADANAAKIAAADAQNKAAPAAPAAPPGYTNNVTRNGNEYSGTNVRGDITINGRPPGGGAISAQNMAAADALASRNGGMADVSGGQGGMALPQAPTVRHSGNDWNARSTLRNAEVSASSITNTRRWGGKGAENSPDVQAYKAMLDNDLALQRTEPGVQLETLRSNNGLRGQKLAADATRYSSDNSLRGTMYSSDATLGAKRMEMQQRLQQQQLRAAIFREAEGKPEVAAKIAASYGMDAKDFTDMAAADQTRAQGAATSARKRLEGMAVRDDGKGGTVVDPGRVANLERTLTKMAPGWQHMSEPEQAELYGKAESSVNLLEGLNDRRNNSFWQSVGVDGKSASLDNLPDMKGGRLTTVKLLEGATTGGGVSRGDYALEVGGHKLYLPRDKVNQGELELLKARGVDISGMQK